MLKGELASHDKSYQEGHSKGVERAFAEIKELFNLCSQDKFTKWEIRNLIENKYHEFVEYCESWGMDTLTESRKSELDYYLNNETNDAETQEWREFLTEKEQAYVDECDESYDEIFYRMGQEFKRIEKLKSKK